MKTFFALPVLLLVPTLSWADPETVSADATDCVYARDVQQFEVVDDKTLLIIGRLDRRWLNRLNTRCAGLRKNMVLNVSRYGSQLCANDRVTATFRGALSGEGPAASCRLGQFEPLPVAPVALSGTTAAGTRQATAGES
ncbi:MAG: hypothetical protein ACFHXK_06520 [bacterium]